MKNIALILIISFLSCGSPQDKKEIDSNSSVIENNSEDEVISVIDNKNETVKLDSLKTKTESQIERSEFTDGRQKDIDHSYEDIIKYLEKVNWRKHSTDRCYVVDLNNNTSLSSIVGKLHLLAKGLPNLNESDVISLLGTPIRKKENDKGLFLDYPFVKDELESATEQNLCQYHVTKSLSSNTFTFPKVVLITELSNEKPDH